MYLAKQDVNSHSPTEFLNCQIQTIKICKIDTTMIQHGHLDPHESEIRVSTAHLKKPEKTNHWVVSDLHSSTPLHDASPPPKKSIPKLKLAQTHQEHQHTDPTPQNALAILSHPGPTSPN